MRLTVIGGIERLKRFYLEEAKKRGHELRVFNSFEASLGKQIGEPECLLLITCQLSHCARINALKQAKAMGIPVRQIHACGVCALRACLERIGAEALGEARG
jgi:hypothetical protein